MPHASPPLDSPRRFLEHLFHTAVATAHPANCLLAHLPQPPPGRLVLLAAGKAAGSMTEIAEQHYIQSGLPEPALLGLAVTREGYSRPTRRIPVVQSGHPVPNEAGLEAAEKTLVLAEQAGANDLVLALLSGGASANWTAPMRGISLADKQATTRTLLHSGASISEINTVRKHLSQIKGGRLAMRAARTRLLTLAISDVPGDDPAVIGSGPTVPDPSSLADAEAIIRHYRLKLPLSVHEALADRANETPKPGDRVFANTEFRIVARPMDALSAARARVEAAGFECLFLGDRVEGEARMVAQRHAQIARDIRNQGRRAIILSGGELTVTVNAQGRGGPNQEYALSLAIALDGLPAIAALAADTDGTDGGSGATDDPAGAYLDGSTLARGRALGLDAAAFLSENDSTPFFSRLGDLVQTGPTFTNVNDFRAILVDTV